MTASTARLAVAALLAAAILLSLQALALAQGDGTSFGEGLSATVTRPSAPASSATSVIIEAKPDGRPQVSGLVRAQKLAKPIQASLAFLVRWGRGASTVAPGKFYDPATPVVVGGQTFTAGQVKLVLPVKDLRVDGSAVRVGVLGLQPPGGVAAYQGPARLTFSAGPDGFVTITRIDAP